MKNKFDIEAKLFMYILKLKEEKNKEYSAIECEYNIAYVFDEYDEFKDYFINNGLEADEELLKLCRMKTTKKGSIIALKGLCDHAITSYRKLNNLDVYSYDMNNKINENNKTNKKAKKLRCK